jgi:hypothetical protein
MSLKNSHKPRTSASGIPLTSDHTNAAARYTAAELAAMLAEPKPVTADAQKIFLRCLSMTGDIVAAAQAAGQDEADFFAYRHSNVGFSAEWDAAMDEAIMRLDSLLHAGVIEFLSKPWRDLNVGVMAAMHRLALSLLTAYRRAKGQKQRQDPHKAMTDKQYLLSKIAEYKAKAGGQATMHGQHPIDPNLSIMTHNG